MFKRSFAASNHRAGKARKISKRSFRDDAKQRLREQLVNATPDTSPTIGTASPQLNSDIIHVIVGQDKRLFAAHEVVLSGSPVLADACRETFFSAPGERRIHLPAEEPAVFAAVLEFLYKHDYKPRLMRDMKRDAWYLEDDTDDLTPHPSLPRKIDSLDSLQTAGRSNIASIYHHGMGDYILRDTLIYCAALRLQLPDLQRLAIRKQGLTYNVDCATILRSARFAYANTPPGDAGLRSHYLAIIIRSRKTFKRSGTMQMEMEKGGTQLFFDLWVAMCNHCEDLSAENGRNRSLLVIK